MTGQQQINSALFIDCGEGFEIKNGARAGQIKYTREPRARFECVRCRSVEGPVSGADRVKAFVASVRTRHVCHPNELGVRAA